MSHTYRRKNFENEDRSSWTMSGWKVNGYYTERGPYEQYTIPDIVDFFEKRKYVHGESRANSRSPGHWIRKKHHSIHRRKAVRELQKFMNNCDYEPMILDNPPTCAWDWR